MTSTLAASPVATGVQREWHLITSEYPPQPGGVSDYSRQVAAGLAAEEGLVHVWCPPAAGVAPEAGGVVVHRELGRITPGALRRVGEMLDAYSRPRRLLVQWVPHGYGMKAMNLPFCLWLLDRSRRAGDEVYLMVHEPYLHFDRGSWKKSAVAAAHRLMSMLLLRAADQVWVSVPAWAELLRPYRLRRAISLDWLPVPSNIQRVRDPEATRRLRERYAPAGERLLGHFGTYGRLLAPLLDELLPELLRDEAGVRMLLLGRGADEYRRGFAARHPELADRVLAPPALDDRALSLHLGACDLFVQLYPDGVNSRRTSAMAVLAHGRPVVSTSGRYTESIWAERGAVALVPEGDARALVALVRRLLADPAERERLGEAGEALYRDRFDISHSVAAIRAAADRVGSAAAGRRAQLLGR